MIPLERLRQVRAAGSRLDSGIHAQFSGAKLIESSLLLLEEERAIKKGDIEKHDWKSGTWGKAKDRLLKESNDKCAYCESPTAVVDYGDVEHYRPKSIYWWLAYCVDNYLVSCAICNQRFKSNKFPIIGNKMSTASVSQNATDAQLSVRAITLVPDPLDQPAVDAFLDLHDDEGTLLVNPYIDNPADFFAWKADVVIEEVELLPADENDSVVVDCWEAAKDVYGLDRPDLRTARYDIFRGYLGAKITVEDNNASAATRAFNQQSIDRMKLDRFPYSGMIRFFENFGTIDDMKQGGFLEI